MASHSQTRQSKLSNKTSIQIDRSDPQRLEKFLQKWHGSQGNERANYQTFFGDLCRVLNVDEPQPKGSDSGDRYCFDKNIKIPHPSGNFTTGFIDFHKADHFLIEAKQGGNASGQGMARRGTASYTKAMERAFVQALSYARNSDPSPPFLLTCDIGSHFELWMGFNGDYGGYGARQTIPLTDLNKPEIFELFVDIFTAPQKRNPEKTAAKVTREVAAKLAELAKSLERQYSPEEVSDFLMRAIFTMFSEDIGLLRDIEAPANDERIFTDTLRERWIKNPSTFKPQVETLWRSMNQGIGFWHIQKLLHFNGGLFADASALELTSDQLATLLEAAQYDWTQVEPAIFGTLLERALDPKERSKLGAHYTPRSYVERLVRPVIVEPLQAEWKLVQAEVKQVLDNGEEQPTSDQKKKAIQLLEEFLQYLREIRTLDPACGVGNFLYVTMDLLKTLESEVFRRLEDVTGVAQLPMDFRQVNPSQFLGIEINRRAANIADLVIWIGYLQWHFRRLGDVPPVEPVLREYKNIECRDAVLKWDGTEVAIDPATGKPHTRWGDRMMTHPVTGEEVPDPDDQVLILKYINSRPAEWPKVDYVVSNPPFIGNARMREVLGDGYAEALRQAYGDVPDTVDYVMYWWSKAAELIRSERLKRFGFITTNTIRQTWQRGVIDFHLNQKEPIRLFFAIPDHPWTNEGAAVRIAMTAVELNDSKSAIRIARFGIVVSEKESNIPEDSAEEIEIDWRNAPQVFSNLQIGANVSKSIPLKSNLKLCCPGVKLHGMGFCLTQTQTTSIEKEVIYPYLNGRDLTQKSRKVMVLDLFGLTEDEVLERYPRAYQWVYDRVKPEREQNNRETYRKNWWIFGEPRANLRPALKDIARYIGTPQTSKHRFFSFVNSQVIPDNQIIVIAIDDAYSLGILSSRVHVVWALASGGTLENRPRYNKSVCFDPFPFPVSNHKHKQKIHELGEKLDAHRKKVQEQHPDVTVTGMYNLLEKLRKGEFFTDNDRAYNDKALVSILKQIHDELDAAVFEAYGWEWDISDEEILKRLVALNAQRAEEERNGLIRWLRSEYQAPNEVQTQQTIAGIAEIEDIPTEATQLLPWSKKPREQLTAIRDLLSSRGGEWAIDQIVSQFKGGQRQKKLIMEHLEALEGLGILLSRVEGNISHWHYVGLQKVA